MDDAGLTPLLIDAKREYVGQLTDVLAPYVVNHMVGLYVAAQERAPKSATLAFQAALRGIPGWNSNTVARHATDVQSKYCFLGDLIAACFVAYVKILSSVKLHQQKPNIRLKLPTNDAFVHKVYIHAAREFYNAPALLRADRAAKVGVVRAAVEASVRDMLPIEDILKAYLGNTVDADDIVPSEFLDDAFGGGSGGGGDGSPPAPPPPASSQQSLPPAPHQYDPSPGAQYPEPGAQYPEPGAQYPQAASAPQPPVQQPDAAEHGLGHHRALYEAADEREDEQVKHVSLRAGPGGGGSPRGPRPLFSDAHEDEFA